VTTAFLIVVTIYAIIFVAGRAHSRYLDRLEARLNACRQVKQTDEQLVMRPGADVDGLAETVVDQLAICPKCGQRLVVRALGGILMVFHKPEINELHQSPEPLKRDYVET
jgi:hypothetical protein